MTSREACRHRIATISRELYWAAVRLQPTFTPEMFDQLEASTLSIGSNWCEAWGREKFGKPSELFLRYACGSAYEAAFQFMSAGESTLEELAHEACTLLDAELVPEVVAQSAIDSALDEAARLTDRRSLLFVRKPSEEDPEA